MQRRFSGLATVVVFLMCLGGCAAPAVDEEEGSFLREKVLEPGRSLPWNSMIEAATGEPLNPAHYARQFVTGA